jgi:hypothetical protein
MSRWPWWFWLPVSAGIVLRIAGLTASPLWYDESFSLAMTRLPLLDMVRTASLDFHPPLWEMIAWVSVRLFGVNEFSLRLPSLLASIGALLLAADFAHRLLTPHAAALGLAALAILPYQLWMAQDGRGYAVMSLLYLAAAWFALKGRWLGMGAALGLMMYINLAAPFYALTIGALCVGWWRRFEIRRYALSGVMAITAFVPWLSSYVHAASAKDFWTVPQTLGWFVTAIVRAMVVDSLPGDWWKAVAVLTVLGSIVAAIAITLAYRERGPVIMAVLGALPFALMLLAVPVKNVILYRPLSALTAPLVLWLAASLIRLPGTFFKSLFGTAWALMGVGGLLAWSAAAKGGELETLAEVINDEWQQGDVIYHATATSALPFEFYLDHPGWVLDEVQHDGLLSWDVQDALGVRRAALEDIPHIRAWVVWARDGFESEAAQARMTEYVRGGVLIGTVHYWQAAPIEVWRVER